jgi:Flp pilus assembly pilin Flp
MKKMFLSLWNDEAGFILSAELVLIATLLVIGMIVGLQTIREAITYELADVASAIGFLDQGYSFGGITGHNSSIAGSVWTDTLDFCDTAGTNGGSSNCVSVGNVAGSASENQ